MQSGELKSGMPDEAEQESIVAWYLVQFRRSLPEQAPHSLSKQKRIATFPRPPLVQIKNNKFFGGGGVDIAISKFYTYNVL